MKKITLLFALLGILLLLFVACDKKENDTPQGNGTKETVATPPSQTSTVTPSDPSGPSSPSGTPNGSDPSISAPDPSLPNGSGSSSSTLTDTTVVPVNLIRYSCAKNNGFDSSVAGTEGAYVSHKNFDNLFTLSVSGARKQADGTYVVQSGETLDLTFTMLYDRGSLPKGDTGEAGWWNWISNTLHNSTYDKTVVGTNITGNRIGYGAYYVKVEYTDGTVEEFSETNFANGMTKNGTKRVSLQCSTEKVLAKVTTVIVYQVKFKIYEWAVYEDISDWRVVGTVEYPNPVSS